MKRARGLSKGVFTVLLSALIAFGLVVFPIRGHRAARGAPASSADKPTPAAPPGASPSARAAAGAAKASPSAAPSASAAAATPAPAKADATKGGEDDLTTLPLGTGLPLGIRVGVFYLDVKSFDDTKGEFVATTDVRLRWTDLRHRFPASEEHRGYREVRFGEADKKLETMWSPHLEIANRAEAPSFTMRRLRIFPNGEVELMTRTTARYKVAIDAARFPFDRQHLLLDLIVRDSDTDEVELAAQHEDVEFSRPARGLTIDGWTAGLVDLDLSEVAGWNGDRYGRLEAALDVDRDPKGALAPVFIPLVASLLIPLLAIWMNKSDEDGFEVEAFELANVVIGGLFSVIALSFAIYSAYGVIAGGDNTVTRLFGLNYVSLASALGVVVLFFRFKLPAKLFGPYVQAEMFRVILWALPVLSTATSIAFILAAKA